MELIDRAAHLCAWLLLIVLLSSIQSWAQTTCDAPLGMEDGTIANSQITCSGGGIVCWHARLNDAGGWYSTRGPNFYSQVDLLSVKLITKVATKGTTAGYWTKSFLIHHSKNGLVWETYQSVEGSSFRGEPLPGNTDKTSLVTNDLNPPIEVRYISIQPVSWHGYPSLKYELYGCATGNQFSTYTNVTEDIEDDQIWILRRSPYTINREIRIRTPGQLTIQPGVRVIFTSTEAKLTVQGRLYARGLPELRVVFSSNTSPLGSPTSAWKGVAVNNEGYIHLQYAEVLKAETGVHGSATSVHLSNVAIHLCTTGVILESGAQNETYIVMFGVHIHHCTRGMRISASTEKPFVVMQFCHIYSNIENGVTMVSGPSRLIAQNSSFSWNGWHGMELQRRSSSGGFVLENVRIEGNKQNGITSYRVGIVNSIAMLSSTISQNGGKGIHLSLYDIYGSQNANWTFQNNTFEGNRYNGLTINCYATRTAHKVALENNTFLSNGRSLDISCYGQIPATYFIRNNYFYKNKQRVHLYVARGLSEDIIFEQNTLLENSGSVAVFVDDKGVLFRHNIIVNCTVTTAVFLKYNLEEFSNNVLSNPHADYEIRTDLEFVENRAINASYNYLGGSDPIFLRSRVHDFFTNSGLTYIDIFPFYLTGLFEELHPGPDGEVFSLDALWGSGGRLETDITIAENSSLEVTRSIWIPEDVTLTIGAGAVLNFHQNRVIHVKGNLVLLGDKNQEIILQGHNGANWYGIRLNNTGITASHVVITNARTCIQLWEVSVPLNIHLSHLTATKATHCLEGRFTTNTSLVLENCVFAEMFRAIAFQFSAHAHVDIQISHTSFRSCRDKAVYLGYDHSTSRFLSMRLEYAIFKNNLHCVAIGSKYGELRTNLTVKDSLFQNNNGNPLLLHTWITEMTLDRNLFSDNGGPVYMYSKACTSRVNIRNNTFQNGKYSEGLTIQARHSGPNDCSFHFYDNAFSKFPARFNGLTFNVWAFSSVHIQRNKFLYMERFGMELDIRGNLNDLVIEENEFLHGLNAMAVRLHQTTDSNITISENQITNNTGGSVVDIAPGSGQNTAILFTWNILENNTGTVVTIGRPFVLMNHNIFDNPRAEYNVKATTSSFGESVINATRNYWGAVDARAIWRKIQDHNSNDGLPLVQIIPFMEDRSLTNMYDYKPKFRNADGTIGGSVNGNVSLDITGSPYTAVGSIEIDLEDRLTVDAGVIIYLLPNVLIKVKGVLVVEGTEADPVSFLPKIPGQKWTGIELIDSLRSDYQLPIRLVGGRSEREGRVELSYGDKFGTICDDSFGTNEAQVVCRMLGFDPYGEVLVHGSAKYGHGEGPIWLDDLDCNGDENSLDKCRFRGWGSHNCVHGEDVGVTCLGQLIQRSTGNNTEKSYFKHLVVNDTTKGINSYGNDLEMDTVSVMFSASNGFSFSGTAVIRHITATDNSGSGIMIQQSLVGKSVSFRVDGCRLSGNVENGILIKSGGEISITNCEISESKNGISLLAITSGSISFTNCNIHRNSEHILYSPSMHVNYGNNFNFSLIGSTVHNHVHSGRLIGWRWHNNPMVDIDVNTHMNTTSWNFVNNFFQNITNRAEMFKFGTKRVQQGSHEFRFSGNILLDIDAQMLVTHTDYRYTTRLTINDNTIINTNNPTNPVIEINSRDVVLLEIKGNRFNMNSGSTVISLLDSYNGDITANVTHNTFTNNTVENTIYSDWGSISIRDNIFSDPEATCELKVPNLRSLQLIDATKCFWGHTDLEKITERVCGFEKNSNWALLNILPYRLSEDPGDLVTLPDQTFFSASVLGGMLSRNLTLTKSGRPYLIRRSIYVPHGIEFVIEDGVTMQFADNRGLIIQGNCQIGGNGKDRTVLSGIGTCTWHGIRITEEFIKKGSAKDTALADGNMNAGGTRTVRIKNTDIDGTRDGIDIHSQSITMSDCKISNTAGNGITIRSVRNAAYDFHGTRIISSGRHGVYIADSYGISVRNVSIQESVGDGIHIEPAYGMFSLSYVTVERNSGYGVVVNLENHQKDQQFKLIHSKISNHRYQQGVSVRTKNYQVMPLIEIEDNMFTNNTIGTLSIKSESYAWGYQERKKISVVRNVFVNSGPNLILVKMNNTLYVLNNQFLDSQTSSDCLLRVESQTWTGSQQESVNKLNILSNTFERVTGRCILDLASPEEVLMGTCQYNQILECASSDASILLDADVYNLTYNILDNPESRLEVRVVKKGTTIVNAENNWWGSGISQQARRRIFDRTEDSSLLLLDIEPLDESQGFDCSRVNNCSGKGECVRPNSCKCISGWTGNECTQHDCSAVSNCFDSGKCVGPNQCSCHSGYNGKRCELATCVNVSDCSGHGICIGPDECFCFTGFAGTSCSDCGPQRWGDKCQSCPRCVHGNCNLDDGTCDCDTDNWAGRLCDLCSDTFYGTNCLPLPTVLRINPDGGADTGGKEVHIRGHNFPRTANSLYFCRFGSTLVEGSRVSREHITCVTPQHEKGVVIVEVSPDGLANFTSNMVTFTFFAECPSSACGKNSSPPHGQCAFGGCLCNLPWSGTDCSLELLAPIIVRPQAYFSVTEGDRFSAHLYLEQGTQPVAWTIISAPPGLVINIRTAELTWENTVGAMQPYTIFVRTKNIVGKDEVSLKLLVPLSYNVTIHSITPTGTLPLPQPVLVVGQVNFEKITGPRVVLVDLQLRNNGKMRQVTVFTDGRGVGKFETKIYPKPDDTGRFALSGNHPSDPEFIEQAHWSVLGMSCSPRYTRVSAYLDDDFVTFNNVANLVNSGLETVFNIRVEVEGIGGPLEDVEVTPSVATGADNSYFTGRLEPQQAIPFDITLRASGPLSGTIAVVFSTVEGTSSALALQIQLNIRKPRLSLSPSSIRDTLLIGSQKEYRFELENIGEATANNVRISLPNDKRFSILGFEKMNSSDSNSQIVLRKEESAVLSLAVTTPKDDQLGETNGLIAIYSNEVSITLPYHFVLTSDNRLNLTVRVEDEFTYFADDQPLVKWATVTLSNYRRGYKELRTTTNTSGVVTFENIHEDKYDLIAKAPGHGSFRAVILAKPTDPSMSIFLERIAVIYTWTVTPTVFQDKYVISLETTFETQVPMPVVTVEPAAVNTIPYEEGRLTVMEFRLTNHGLIQADNVRLTLPDGHPTLIFIQTIDDLGHLAANSSVTILVHVERRSALVRKRRSTGNDCRVTFFWDFICGTLQTRQAGSSLNRRTPGRPPQPCRPPTDPDPRGPPVWRFTPTIHGPGPGAGPGSRWYVPKTTDLVYRPITPISCDCLKTFIKECLPFGKCAVSAASRTLLNVATDCILPMLPMNGCLKAGIGAASSFTWSFLDILSSVIDLVVSCLVSTICPVCGPAWSTIKCVFNVGMKCNYPGSGRKRREVSSAIVDNFVNQGQPMNNFLDLAEGVFGDRSMLELPDNSWYSRFKTSITDQSQADNYLTADEASDILGMMNDTTARATVDRFLHRWNNTVVAFNDGSLGSENESDNTIPYDVTKARYQKFTSDQEVAKEVGFDSIFDRYDKAANTYKEALEKQIQKGYKADEGVCAKVRVKIVQDLVLTREAFNARLEIENGEQSELGDIRVTIEINPIINPEESATDKFSIGDAELVGITGVDGEGTLETSMSGTADWLIVPYASAAIRKDTLYDVGGSFSYSVEGSTLTVSLVPDTITVKPNPNLVVHYFHEKYIRGDDALTEDIIEPVVPFTLAVMITNTGYGTARSLQITSAQPEIIENEKGLLVAFKIIGAQLAGKPIAPSLTVDFGDIEPFQTLTARWKLTSSLKGLFYNYSATFENINPLGDPQLSVLDVLRYHELIHLVRIDQPEDDGFDDFLVNDDLDADEMADHLFDSRNGVTHTVEAALVLQAERRDESRKKKSYTHLTLTATVEEGGWTYIRHETSLADAPLTRGRLLRVTRDDGKEIKSGTNTWTTNYYRDTGYFHLVDFSHRNATPANITYTAIFGYVNLFAPRFEQAEYHVSLKIPVSRGAEILVLKAMDDDEDIVLYTLNSPSATFKIDRESGTITTSRPINTEEEIVLNVTAEDDGIPSRSSMVKVTVKTAPILARTTKTTTQPTGRKTTSASNHTTPDKSSPTPTDSSNFTFAVTTEMYWNDKNSTDTTSTGQHSQISHSLVPFFAFILFLIVLLN